MASSLRILQTYGPWKSLENVDSRFLYNATKITRHGVQLVSDESRVARHSYDSSTYKVLDVYANTE